MSKTVIVEAATNLRTHCEGRSDLEQGGQPAARLLPRVEGIIIVDLPTWFHHEQEENNASRGYHCEHDKKYFHDVSPQVPPREIYTTIDCSNDGENGFRRSLK